MKILIEGYPYREDTVAPILKNFEPFSKDGTLTVDYVGYFYSKETADCVFFLPKVVMDERGSVLFKGDITPEAIVDVDAALRSKAIDHNDYLFLSNFAVWIFRAVKEYRRRHPDSEILLHKTFSLLDRSNHATDATLLDVILSLVRFNNENRDFFMFTVKNEHSGNNKINWNKTISKSPAAMQGGRPIYLNVVNKKKRVDFDEELLVIYFSILNHVNQTYGFKIPIDYNYDLITGSRFEMLFDGHGTSRLKRIKYKYFSDRALMLWQLCYAFFDASERIHSSTQDCDYLLARNFNIVFESIIDDLIGDRKQDIDSDLIDQPDGKIVDHIFRYPSPVNGGDMYYIGDSKYYKIGATVGRNSVYKQYTYAKNVIQMNIDWFFDDRKAGKTDANRRAKVKYRDELTEGYNITPNFFISAKMKSLSYADPELEQRETDDSRRRIFQFENRLFDRDTLWLSHYDINFLYVVALYARADECEIQTFKETVRAEFRNKISSFINDRYDFYLLQPQQGYTLSQSVEATFKLLHGKIFRPDETKNVVILSLEKGFVENASIMDDIRRYFQIINKYKAGENIDDVKWKYLSTATNYDEFTEDCSMAAEPEARYKARQ